MGELLRSKAAHTFPATASSGRFVITESPGAQFGGKRRLSSRRNLDRDALYHLRENCRVALSGRQQKEKIGIRWLGAIFQHLAVKYLNRGYWSIRSSAAIAQSSRLV